MATRDAARAGAQPGSILVVIHDFRARSADELSLAKGDRIELIERDDEFNDGWFLGRHIVTAVTGLFPEVYTTLAPKQSLAQTSAALRRTSGSMPNAVQATQEASVPVVQQRPASATLLQQQRPTSGTISFAKPPAATRSSLPTASVDTKSLGLTSSQSPVMHETLTVIDEHMNDMNPAALRNTGRRDTMSSMYSSYPNNRMSYIAGHETEDEEGQMYTEAEVMQWSAAQVSEYLEDHGVEKPHCRVFREQEITGEVLLAMDQSSVFLKEFDLGAVGPRLRTWHKIKALQEEVQRQARPGALNNAASPATHELDTTDSIRSVSTSAMTNNRSVAPLKRSSMTMATDSPQSASSSRRNSAASPLLSGRQDTTFRPSAQNIRTMQHWRHSSIDSAANSLDGSFPGGPRKGSTTGSQLNGRSGHGHSHNISTETAPYVNKEAISANATTSSPSDVDKGYFSSTEAESRARRTSVLQKKQDSLAASSTHSRSGSYLSSYARQSVPTGRGASTDSLHDPIVSPISSPGLTPGSLLAGGFKTAAASRAISMPNYGNKAMSTLNESAPPIVTKLEPSERQPPSGAGASEAGTPGIGSRLPFFSKTSKIPGMRAISDAVTRSERTTVNKEADLASPTKDGGMSTPSTSAASFDMKSGQRTSAGSAGALTPQQPAQRRAKPKTKKSTSAYTRGLEKKSPAEQMVDCDYSGWMKKKSGSLMTTWKPRLFVLRGRRLSYYYSENDTEEKGLIDISFHNVMPAMDERLISMHAAVTGAGAQTTSPTDTLTTTAQQELMDSPALPGSDDDGLFIFKLTPPKSGRGVNFTKPTVHYFAVSSRQEGRLWMAALMKAVIARDEDSVVTTTYSQQTISLAKARARKERPPALKDETGNDYDEANDGLGIGGLRPNGASTPTVLDGADRPWLTEDNSSFVASSVPTAAPSIVTDLGDVEREQLAGLLH